eukprot:gene6759-7856_t
MFFANVTTEDGSVKEVCEGPATTFIKSYLTVKSLAIVNTIEGTQKISANTPTSSPYNPTTYKSPPDPTQTSPASRAYDTPPSTPASPMAGRADIGSPSSVLPPKRVHAIDPSSVEYSFTKVTPSAERQHIEISYDCEPAKIKASGLGRYFHFGCDRQLAFATRAGGNSNTAKSVKPGEMSPIQAAMVNAGYTWEEEVMEALLVKKGTRVFRPEKGAPIISYATSLSLLREERESCYLVQCLLEAPESFRQTIPSFVSFSNSIPDFLYLRVENGVRTLTILDAKSTRKIDFSQKIQLAYYYILLKAIIAHEKLNIQLNDQAAIFLKGNYVEQYFRITDTVSLLDPFLYGNQHAPSRLVAILSRPREQADWSLTQRCDGCEYIEHCKSQASTQRRIEGLPTLLSSELLSLIAAARVSHPESSDLAILSSITKNIASHDHPSLLTELITLSPIVQAIMTNKVVPTGCVDVSLASKSDIAIHILLLQNPLDQSLFHWLASSPSETIHNTNFGDLIHWLSNQFFKHNMKQSVQCYILDHFEQAYFFKLALERLKRVKDDAMLTKEVLVVLRVLLHTSDWINLNIGGVFPSEQAGGKVPSIYLKNLSSQPFIVIKEQVHKSVAINSYPIYTLASIAQHMLGLDPATLPRCLDNDLLFVDSVQKNDHNQAAKLLGQRLDYHGRIIEALREIVFKSPTDRPAPLLQIRDELKYLDPNLNKMMFCYQHEAVASLKELRAIRSRRPDINFINGNYIKLTYRSNIGNEYLFSARIHVLNYSTIVRRFQDRFQFFMLLDESSVDQLGSFNDLTYKEADDKQFVGVSKQIIGQAIPGDKMFYNTDITVTVKNMPFDMVVGGQYALVQRYDSSYFTQTKPLHAAYDRANEQKESSPLLSILDDPISWIRLLESDQQRTLQVAVQHTIKDFGRAQTYNPQLRLFPTPSQLAIINSIISHPLQLVCGPPGTGKTHFLALMVLIIMETLHRLQVDAYTICITAHTHSAIDVLLVRIAELKREYETSVAGNALPFVLAKKDAGYTKHGLLAENGIIQYDAVKCTSKFIVIGSTCWGTNSLKREIDLLIIDEASQLSSSLAALAINSVKMNGGRIVVCGDPKQLGPVLKAKYTVDKQLSVTIGPREPKLHKSIFSCLKTLIRDRDRLATPFLSLCENFRMTTELCLFFSSHLYGPTYNVYKDNQTLSHLPMLEPWRSNEILNQVFGRNESCHTILLDDKQFGERSLEIEIVRKIYQYLVSRHSDESMPPDTNEYSFWADKRLGIVTPLNAQRIDMQQMVVYEQTMRGCRDQYMPSIGTAEKMQGQEYDTVIVCYNGWSRGQTEGSDFIFNLNRLNVAFSRAKTRLILIVSNALLNPDARIFNDVKASRAYQYLRSFIGYSSIHRFQVKSQPSRRGIGSTSSADGYVDDLQNDFVSKLKGFKTAKIGKDIVEEAYGAMENKLAKELSLDKSKELLLLIHKSGKMYGAMAIDKSKEFCKDHPVVVGTVVLGTTLAFIVPVGLHAAGFTAAGIAKNSYAAWAMSKGIVIPALQSAGAKGGFGYVGTFTSSLGIVEGYRWIRSETQRPLSKL